MKRNRKRIAFLTILLLCSTMNIQSHADVFRGIDPGVIQKQTEQSLELREKIQQLKQEQDQKKLDNSTKIDESAVQNTSLIDNSSGVIYNPKFLLRSVAFKGNTIYSSSELSKYYQNLIGKEVYIDQVLGATMEITKRYSQDGYITSQAYIPQQKVADGIITVEVIESEIGNISINGNKWARSSYLNRTVLSSNNLKAGKVFNVSNLKTSLDELNKEDYIQGKIVIEEGSTPKKTDLTLEVRDRFPIEVTVGLDNDGRTVAGRDRGYMQVKNKNLLGFGDEAYVGGLLGQYTGGWFGGYKLPVGKYGTKIGADYSNSRVNPGGAFKEYDIKGVANTIKVGIYQPIAKGENYKLNSDLTLNFLNARTTAGLFNDAALNDYQLRVLRAGIDYQKDDSRGRWITRLEGSLGLSGMGATPNEDYLPKSTFQKYNLDALRLQLLPKDMLLIGRASGQYSPDKLYAIEQMQLGGAATVRGFEPALLLGDWGYFGSLELRTPVPGLKAILPAKYKNYSDKVRLGYFYDFGYTANNRISSTDEENFIQSIGVGANFYVMKNLTASLNLAFPLHEPHYDTAHCKVIFNVSSDIASFAFKDPKERL